jgi:soluble lytic murein transglycosylase
LSGTTLAFSEEKKILPIKKPILSDSELQKKVLVNIIKPLPKPDLSKEQKKTEVADEENNQSPQYLLPKKKPLIAGINIKPDIDKSKFYSKKDFSLAKKAVAEMKKSDWTNALKTAKKAKDKSIYNFIQWRHLLTKGNKASFYEYLNFINSNPNYPRIGRIKYLAEHKLSNEKITPGKIIDWFGDEEPLSGYGKMILGESYILSGQTYIGKKLIKDGWITAELSKTDLRFFRKKFQKHLNADDYIKRADYPCLGKQILGFKKNVALFTQRLRTFI